MHQSFEIAGMHSGSCVRRVLRALTVLADEVTVTLCPPMAIVAAEEPLAAEQVDIALGQAGHYRLRAGPFVHT
jgi:hypothetical protein